MKLYDGTVYIVSATRSLVMTIQKRTLFDESVLLTNFISTSPIDFMFERTCLRDTSPTENPSKQKLSKVKPESHL
jgi:hypothetical protein